MRHHGVMTPHVPISRHLDLYSYWLSKRNGRLIPARRDIDPAELGRLLPFLCIFGKAAGEFRRGLLALNLAAAAGGAIVFVNTVVIVRSFLHYGDQEVAITLGAFGLGSMTAALSLPRLLDALADRKVMLSRRQDACYAARRMKATVPPYSPHSLRSPMCAGLSPIPSRVRLASVWAFRRSWLPMRQLPWPRSRSLSGFGPLTIQNPSNWKRPFRNNMAVSAKTEMVRIIPLAMAAVIRRPAQTMPLATAYTMMKVVSGQGTKPAATARKRLLEA